MKNKTKKISVISQSMNNAPKIQLKNHKTSRPHIIQFNNRKKYNNLDQQRISGNFSKFSEQIVQNNQIIQRLSTFIQTIEQIIKEILFCKDTKYYLQLAKTSETEIIDNYNKALIKFKDVHYLMKEQQRCKLSRNKEILIENKFITSKSLKNLRNQIVNSPLDNLLKQKVSEKINVKMLDLILKYFQTHMIAESHWSQGKQQSFSFQQIKQYIQHLHCCGSEKQSLNISNHQLTETMNKICQEIAIENRNSMLQKMNQQSSIKNNLFQKPNEQILEQMIKIEGLKPIKQMTSVQKITYLFDLQSKIMMASQFLESALYFKDDITTLPKSDYASVWQHIHINQMGSQSNITFEYRLMKKLFITTNASVIKDLEKMYGEESLIRKILFGLSFPSHFFNYKCAKLQSHKIYRKPSIHTIKSIWNLPQNGWANYLKKTLLFDPIQVNIQFYIPRPQSHKLNSFINRQYPRNLNIFANTPNSIKVRLLNNRNVSLSNKKIHQTFQTIIIHFHGGGFIALSSCTTQTYTRKWANNLNVPVFSIDYGKPPQYRFPVPVLDCLQAYQFIVKQIHKYFNIQPKRIFVAGDSAGGNLACSLTGLILKLKLHKPQGLFLAYPAVDTRTNFSPSRINSFNDVILYPTLLMLCMHEYLGDVQTYQTHPLASPILLSENYINDQIVSKQWPHNWPRTIIMVGKKDPLFDDSLKLCQKLSRSGIDFHCQIYKNLCHAFLSMDQLVVECQQTIKDSIYFLKILIQEQIIRVNKSDF